MSNPVLKSLNSISANILNGANIDNREYARKILNYPAMMIPSAQESILKSLIEDLPDNPSLIDPFMGASNTLVTAMRYGADVYGQDINPLSVLVSQVKTHIYRIEALRERFNLIEEKLKESNSAKITVNFRNIDKWFRKDVQVELSQIRTLISTEKNIYFRKFFWVALAEVIRVTSNDRTSTFKMHVRKIEEIESRNLSPKSIFCTVCKRSIDDLNALKVAIDKASFLEKGNYTKKVSVKWGDSKKKVRTNSRFNLLVTSPPYGDNQTTVTYGQFSYLPLQWIPVEDIDEEISMDYLKVIQEIDRSSLGGKLSNEYNFIEEKMFNNSKSLKRFFDSFNSEERRKAKKVVTFINDLDVTIDNVIKKMRDESYLVWTIGNRNVNKKEVQNDAILIELMENKGIGLFTRLEREILNKRMPRRNNYSKTMNKEEILIFKMI